MFILKKYLYAVCVCVFLVFSLVYWFKHDLKEIGKKLKAKGVAVDVINFGDKDGPRAGVCLDRRDVFKNNRIPRESKKASLEALVTAANDNDNSHILHVPEDQFSLRDHLSRLIIYLFA
jgi:hypothetical protein